MRRATSHHSPRLFTIPYLCVSSKQDYGLVIWSDRIAAYPLMDFEPYKASFSVGFSCAGGHDGVIGRCAAIRKNRVEQLKSMSNLDRQFESTPLPPFCINYPYRSLSSIGLLR